MSVWAVLAAAGAGERLGAERPKAFVALGERVLLAESLERLDASEWVDAVVVAAPPGWGGTAMPKNWNRRFKHNRDKMKTGDIMELAEVVRNLALRDQEKGLSTGEKQMFVKAKKILASELMYAKALDEDSAAAWLDEVLEEVATPPTRHRAVAAKA